MPRMVTGLMKMNLTPLAGELPRNTGVGAVVDEACCNLDVRTDFDKKLSVCDNGFRRRIVLNSDVSCYTT